MNKDILRPSKEFEAFLRSVVLNEVLAVRWAPVDVLEMQLWHAAEFDSFRQTGIHQKLLDGSGVPRDEAMAYSVLIRISKVLAISGGTAEVTFDEYYDMFSPDRLTYAADR